MTPLNAISATQTKALKNVKLIDIREPDEYVREHITGAVNLPLSALKSSQLELDAGEDIVFYCRSGNRTQVNCNRLADIVSGQAQILDGGITAWKMAGLPVTENRKAPMEIQRQVQITAGFLALLGAILGYWVNPLFFGLSAFIGAGLMFSGLTGSCAMGVMLSKMPWNRKASVL